MIGVTGVFHLNQDFTRSQLVELSTTLRLSVLELSLSTRIRRTHTQLKDGVIVLKLNSKNLSTTGFFWGGGTFGGENCSFLLTVDGKGEEGELLSSVGGKV